MMKKFFLLFLLSLFLPRVMWAEEEYVEVERFYYFLDAQTQTARVAQPLGVCQGDAVAIPEVVNYKGKRYSVTGIAAQAFKNNRMYSLALPSSLRHIEEEAFSGCASLVVLKLPAQLESIGKRAFSDCAALTKLKLPGSLQKLEAAAFHGCPRISQIRVEQAQPLVLPTQPSPFGPRQYAKAVLIVPNGAVEVYKAAEGWSGFATIREESATALPTLTEEPTLHTNVYDLQGLPVEVEKANSPALPQGIYIVNGQKVQRP